MNFPLCKFADVLLDSVKMHFCRKEIKTMKEIRLRGKKIVPEKSPLLIKYSPSEDWLNYWTPKSGNWECDGEWMIGTEPGNKGGILYSKECYEEDVMMSFTVTTQLPATRDLNAVFCSTWDDEADYLGPSYICGLNGWYEHKSGIEKSHCGKDNISSTTQSYKYVPGTQVRMTVGSINGHTFMVVDDEVVTEMIDSKPLTSGHIGFSAYCTILKVKDIEIRKIYWEKLVQKYTPEF